MFRFVGKKGQPQWVMISLIILVISLGVLIFLFMKFNSSSLVDRQACAESVVLKATLPEVQVAQTSTSLKDQISLKCKTKRVCVTSKPLGSGNCSSAFGKEFETFRVSGTVDQKENKIRQMLAREMADCWSMLGEGKLQIFGNQAQKGADFTSTGIICTRIMFDDTITSPTDQTAQIREVPDFTLYLYSHKVPGKDISYADYFTNAVGGTTAALLTPQDRAQKIDLNNQTAIMFIQFTKSNANALLGFQLGGFAGGVAGGALTKSLNGVSIGFAAGAVAGSYLGSSLDTWVGGDENYASSILLVPYTEQGFSSITATKDSKGNSLLELANIP